MKVVHINTSDIVGGAGIAAHRLHLELLNKGIDSKMLVLEKKNDEKEVFTINRSKYYKFLLKILNSKLEYLNFYRHKKRKNKIIFSSGKYGIDILSCKEIQEADIIHLHWINSNYINLKTLKKIGQLNKKIVWTLHDMWPFTGGCHYTNECKKYKGNCGNCEILESFKEEDITRKILLSKEKIYSKIDLTIIGCSHWISSCAKESSLFHNYKIYTIPNFLNEQNFKKIDKNLSREILNLDKNKKYILFGAINSINDERKGYKYFKEALEVLKKDVNFFEEIEILIFGASYSEEKLPFKSKFMGHLYDEYTINLLYNSADIFVAPSVEENLANTVNESLTSGTAVVAFNIGGMPDMIDHMKNGYLAEDRNSLDLATGIKMMLSSSGNIKNKLNHSSTSQKIVELYKNLLLEK